MPELRDVFKPPDELVLGKRFNRKVSEADQSRQRAEVDEILSRLRRQPGVVLADEVGMGKTFVALAVACSIASRNPRGPVIIMVPANLIDKWIQDLKTFCELYLENRQAVDRGSCEPKSLKRPESLRFGVARHSIDLMKLLDDSMGERCHLIFLAQGALARQQTDKWIRLALIAEALRRHGRGGAERLIKVKGQIHRYLAELVWAIGTEKNSELGEELWKRLLRTDPATWRTTLNSGFRGAQHQLPDDPVPKAVLRTLRDVDLRPLAEALKAMPVVARGGETRVSERIREARKSIRAVEEELWRTLLAQARWRSPLLVMDEAHHLKNPSTRLARALQSPELVGDLKTGDGAMANAFDRMLFLTATPFQLGHRELVRVLERFGDVRWDKRELGEKAAFQSSLRGLQDCLDESQRKAIALQRAWTKLRPEDVVEPGDGWWQGLLTRKPDELSRQQRAVVDAFLAGKTCRMAAEGALRPWIVRHSKGAYWSDSGIARRLRREGAAIAAEGQSGGLKIPSEQLLPFYLAARSAARPGQDLLGEALCSSYEAFRWTSQRKAAVRDDLGPEAQVALEMSHAKWYLKEFDAALGRRSGRAHPKVDAMVRRVVDLWEKGEKVLVFAFYRLTCNWVRTHISDELERRLVQSGIERLSGDGKLADGNRLEVVLERVRERYIDKRATPGRRALDEELHGIVSRHEGGSSGMTLPPDQRELVVEVMRRFLRVSSTLTRYFPLEALDDLRPEDAVSQLLDFRDISQVSWRQKFGSFVEFLANSCSSEERRLYLDAARTTETGAIRVGGGTADLAMGEAARQTLANVQVATGDTPRDQRARLMRAFNTPFFPDILVCSQVMGEGVDLQRFCRHVIHHDLDWNPSTIEQRTGRVDRIGCKAEGRHSIEVFLPYLAGAADDRQFQVMSERERWFRVVMGEDEVAKLITPDSACEVPLPEPVAKELAFDLSLEGMH